MEKRGRYHNAAGRDFHRIRVRSYMSVLHVATSGVASRAERGDLGVICHRRPEIAASLCSSQ